MIRFRPLLLPTVVTLVGMAMLIGLGVWQVQRLQWKLGLIATVNARIHAEPIPLAEALELSLEQAEWRRVRVEGEFIEGKEAYLFGIGPSGQAGVHVVAPLKEDSGAVVLIDRGFVPNQLRDPATRRAGQPHGRVAVTGIFRLSQNPISFTPSPDAGRQMVFIKNVPALAAILGVMPDAPILIEADNTPHPGGFPLGGQTVVEFSNSHLQYALTWFGLALALLAVYLVYHHKQGRLGFD